jgi:NADPH:quinone reductase-like Zn-dependent oxidoreductase
MRVLTQDRYGSADVLRLEEVPVPEPGPGQVRLRVHAAGVNALDWHLMRGAPLLVRPALGLRRPKHAERGVDVAGVVEAIGPGAASRFAIGDAVLGWCFGAFADYACADQDELVAKPPSIDFEQAAAIPTSATTAWRGLHRTVEVQPGQRVLIIGASGGVGSYAVQIAKAAGAEVTGVCSARNVELVRSLGADHVVDYTREDPLRGNIRYDVIVELAGTTSPLRYRHALTRRGTLVLSSGVGGRWLGPLGRMILGLAAAPFVSQRIALLAATTDPDELQAVTALVESGAIRPVMDRRFPLAEAAEAIRYIEMGHTQGKSVVVMS